jgi:hypothetical protein
MFELDCEQKEANQQIADSLLNVKAYNVSLPVPRFTQARLAVHLSFMNH